MGWERVLITGERGYLEKPPLIRTLEFSLFITGIVSRGVEGLFVGAEEVLELYTTSQGCAGKCTLGRAVLSQTLGLHCLIYAWKSLSGLLNHGNKFVSGMLNVLMYWICIFDKRVIIKEYPFRILIYRNIININMILIYSTINTV